MGEIMNKEELFEKKKNHHINSYKKIARYAFVSNLFFTFFWVIIGLCLSKETIPDDAIEPYISYIMLLLCFVFLVVMIFKIIIVKSNDSKKINYFSEEEKKLYLKSFLKSQLIYSIIILIGILVIIIGLTYRGSLGIQIATIGIAITGFGVSICLYNRIVRKSYLSKKSNVINDIIKERGLYHSTSIIDRLIILILIIVVFVLLYIFIFSKFGNIFVKNLLYLLYLFLTTYYAYVIIKCINKMK